MFLKGLLSHHLREPERERVSERAREGNQCIYASTSTFDQIQGGDLGRLTPVKLVRSDVARACVATACMFIDSTSPLDVWNSNGYSVRFHREQ